MTKEQVITLMKSSMTSDQWDDNADKVKDACGGYPSYWWAEIIQSGLARRVMARFGETPDLKVTVVR